MRHFDSNAVVTPLLYATLSRLWNSTTGIPSIRLAVIDGPVDERHQSLRHIVPDLPAHAVCSHTDTNSCIHGTYIASLLFGSHALAKPLGIAPNCTPIIRPIFTRHGVGIRTSQCSVAAAIVSAIAAGAHIINVSASELSQHLTGDAALLDSIALCAKHRVLVVASTGNDGCNCDTLPASLDNVLAVGAHDNFGAPLPMSNWGHRMSTHGLLAPGKDIPGALAGTSTGVVRLTGTSAAAAIVSGIAALLLSAESLAGRTPDPIRIRNVLLNSADNCNRSWNPFGRRCLLGQLNVDRVWTTLFPEYPMAMNTSVSNLPDNPPLSTSPIEDGANHARPSSTHTSITVARQSGVTLAACGDAQSCGCQKDGGATSVVAAEPKKLKQVFAGGPRHQLAIAFGRLGYDFDSLARRDSLRYSGVPIDDPVLFAQHLLDPAKRSDSEDVIWTVIGDNDVPVCALQPTGTFSERGYGIIVEFFADQYLGIDDGAGARDPNDLATFAAIPGHLIGTAILANAGIEVPVLRPFPKGMGNGTFNSLLNSVFNTLSQNGDSRFEPPMGADPIGHVTTLLQANDETGLSLFAAAREKVTSLAVTSRDRAIRFVTYTIAIFFSAIGSLPSFDVEYIDAELSASMPIDRDYQDVRIKLIDRTDTTIPPRLATIVIDVTDVLPRFVEVRSFRTVTA